MDRNFKVCKACGQCKSLDEFYRLQRWHHGVCKACYNLKIRKYRLEHIAEIRAGSRMRSRRERITNPERVRGRGKKYDDQHKAEHSIRGRIYRAAHKSELAQKQRLYQQTAKGRMVYRNGCHNRRARMSGAGITPDQWRTIVSNQDRRCYWCRHKFGEAKLTIDHVIPLSLGGPHERANIVAACKPCNSSKRDSRWSLI